MPIFQTSPTIDIYYQVGDFTDPWREAETVLLLHGNAESSLAWYGWIPHLARTIRVVRPDMRGHGDSTPMPRDFGWTLDIADIPRITCPTLVITTEHSGLSSVEETRAWQPTIADSKLLVALPIGVVMARRVSKALSELAEEAQAVCRFEFSKPVEVASIVKEVDNLAGTMDVMKRTIRRFLDITSAVAAEKSPSIPL